MLQKREKNILLIMMLGIISISLFLMYQCSNKSTQYNILIIHSFDKKYDWRGELNRGLRDGFRKNLISANISNIYLPTQLSNHESEKDTLDLFLETVGDNIPDLIITCGDEATTSILNAKHPIIYTVPIVFSGVDFIDSSLLEDRDNITGFLDAPDFVKCYKLARQLFGRISEVVVIGNDNTDMGRLAIQEVIRQFSQLDNLTDIHESFPTATIVDTLAFSGAVVNPFSLHIERVEQLTGSALKRSLYYKLNSFCILPKWNEYYSHIGSMGTAPFLMVNSEGFGDGRIGGYITPAYNQGYNASSRGSEILKGQPISKLPIIASKQYPVFDWDQLVFWEIDQSLLPEDSIIPNQPFYIKYKTPLIASAIIGSLFILLFISLLARLYRRESLNKKQAQDNLIKEQQELDITMNSLTEGVISVNKTGLILSINNAAIEWLQLDPKKSYLGKSIWPLMDIQEKDNPSYLKELIASFYHQANESVKLKDAVYAVTSKKKVFPVSGNVSSLVSDGKSYGVVITFRDVTNESTQKQFLALSMAGNVFAWRYERKARLIHFDEVFFETYNIPNDGSNTMTIEDYLAAIHPDDYSFWRERVEDVLSGKLIKGTMQYRMNLGGLGYVWWEYRISLITNLDEDNQYKYIGICLNVDHFKKTEEEMMKLKEEAEESDKMKGVFLANMSHEVRTPLNAIVGFSSILIDSNSLPEKDRREFIDIINENCRLLLNLINEILDISRIESGTHFREEACDLTKIINDVIKTNEVGRPSTVDLIVDIPENPVIFVGDSFRLSQMMSNLLDNAYKFTSKGEVRIGYKPINEENEIEFFVKDTGVGIAEEDKEQIFDRFYKADDFVQGGGLGLSIVKEIVKRCDGRLDLFSKKEQGANFHIYLPVKENVEVVNSETKQEEKDA